MFGDLQWDIRRHKRTHQTHQKKYWNTLYLKKFVLCSHCQLFICRIKGATGIFFVWFMDFFHKSVVQGIRKDQFEVADIVESQDNQHLILVRKLAMEYQCFCEIQKPYKHYEKWTKYTNGSTILR